MRQKQSFEGVFRRGEPDLPFRYVAFDVPPGAQRIEVSYHFQRDEQPEGKPADVIDVGIFDARGADFLSGGFRGWSGGARRSFVITPHEATPGYVRGPLIPGEWRVLLGARINHSAVMPYWLHLNIDSDPEALDDDPATLAQQRARSSAPRTGPGRWYKGDFHSHTVHSDGYNSIDEYAVEARRVGLDFLAITDHNTTSHFEEIAQQPVRGGLLLIPGEEVTTFWGHANVWGAGCWVDFRATDGAGMERIMQFVEGQGGLFSVNHPKPTAGYPWEFHDVRDYRIVEAWQGAWRWHNHESIDFWERRLAAGDRAVAVGGSDCHSIPPAVFNQPWTLGNPCTWVYVQGPLDEEGILDAVRAGHAFISEDPTGPYLELTAECEGASYLTGDVIAARQGAPVRLRVRYRGPAGKTLRLFRGTGVWQEARTDREEQEFAFELPLEAPGYLRAVVAGFRGRPERGEVVHAMTNPVYLAPEEA